MTLIDRVWDMAVEGGLSIEDRGKIAAALKGVEAERERCAKIADAMAEVAKHNGDSWVGHRIIPLEIAKRIRAA